MVDKTKDELKRDKAARIIVMINTAQDMLDDLKTDVTFWSSHEDISAEDGIKHQMHQNETCANLRFLVDYLENKSRRS